MTEDDILIFLADDDEDDRLIFNEAIAEISSKVDVKEASDGLKLIKLLNETSRLPDIIFLDLNMPFQSGKETLKALRSNKAFKNIPVVIYSTSANPMDIEETYRLGASLYLEKPYSMAVMIRKLEHILAHKWEVVSNIDRKDYFISSKEVSNR
ncbi:MAG TPA: response regulator [Bacteroidia bacterium]|jgi:CheY-like chemotaxis protein